MRLFITLLCVLLILAAVPVLAQEATATPAPAEDVPPVVVVEEPALPITDPGTAADLLIGSVATILQGLLAAPLTIFIVDKLKKAQVLRPIMERFNAQQIAFAVAAGIWIIGTVMAVAGYQTQFESAFDFLTKFVGIWNDNLYPLIAGLTATLVASNAGYNAVSGKIAGVGPRGYRQRA